MNYSGAVTSGLSSTAITQIVIEAIIAVLGLSGNLIIIVIILNTKRLRKVTNYFIVSLCLVGLIIASCVIPVHILAEYKIDNQDFCLAAYTLILVFCMCSVLTLLAIATERYSAIVAPFSYVKWITQRRVLVSIVVIWGTSSLTAVYPIVAHKTQTRDANNTLCNFQNAVPKEGGIPCFCIMFICILITSAMYIKIMSVARRQSKRIAALEVSDFMVERPNNLENAGIFHTTESAMDLNSTIPRAQKLNRVSYSAPDEVNIIPNIETQHEAETQTISPRKYDKSTNTVQSELILRNDSCPHITNEEIKSEYLKLMEIYHKEVQRKQTGKDPGLILDEKHTIDDIYVGSDNKPPGSQRCGDCYDGKTNNATLDDPEVEKNLKQNNVCPRQSNVAIVEPFRIEVIENTSDSDINVKPMRRRTLQSVRNESAVKKKRVTQRMRTWSAPKNERYEDALDRVRQRGVTVLSDVEALFSIAQNNKEPIVKSNLSDSPGDIRGTLDRNLTQNVIRNSKSNLSDIQMHDSLSTQRKDNGHQIDLNDTQKPGKWFLESPNETFDDKVFTFDNNVTSPKRESLNVPESEYQQSPRRSNASSCSRLPSISEICELDTEAPSAGLTTRTPRRSMEVRHSSDQQDDVIRLRRSTLKRSLSVRERLVESFHNFQERRKSKTKLKEIKRVRRERRTTLFLGAVILYFFVAYTPLLVTLSLFYYDIKPFNAITILAYLLIFASCVVNPFIYGFGYREYRKSLQNMFCKSRDRLTSRMSSSD